MAAGAPAGKLVLKPGVIHGFLDNFNKSADNECMLFVDVKCTRQDLETLGKNMDEVKDC